MNENTPVPPRNPGENPSTDCSPPPPAGRQGVQWSKLIWDCNPFFLVSAGLLLYGCYRISTDPGVSTRDSLHLYFNFGSLQLYELLLVVTAIFLASRRIWYDSTLLVGLENLLLMAPFILISQGALVGQQLAEQRLTWELSAVAGLLACLRIGSLRKFIGRLNFPKSMAALGVIFVAVNAALPAIYRSLQEGKVGTHVDAGPAYVTNELAWMLLLPALCALAFTVPRMTHKGELWPERGWLPAGMFAFWLTGTFAHLYCLGYIYDFDLRPELVAPSGWVFCWVLFLRVTNMERNRAVYNMALLPPIIAACLAIPSARHHTFFLLSVMNAGLYALIFFRRRNQMTLHLLVLSIAASLGGLPLEWGTGWLPHFTRAQSIWAATAGYGLFWAMQSRNPASGILGSLITAIVVGVPLKDSDNAVHWAVQAGLVALLVHSLRWEDEKHQGAPAVRLLTCAGWVIHSFVWVHTTGSGWLTLAMTAPLWLAYAAFRIYHGAWGPRSLAIAAALVLLTGPGDSTAARLRDTSTGVVAVIGSFVLFAIGTATALYRHRRATTCLTKR